MRLRTILIGLTALALVLAPTGDASAARKRTKVASSPTTLSIDSAVGNEVTGSLASPYGVCVPDRLVRVTRDGVHLGSDTTDEDGEWRVPAADDLSGGEQLVATVDKVTVTHHGRKRNVRVTCGSDIAQSTVGTPPVNPSGTFALSVEVFGGPDDLGVITSSPPGINCRDDNQQSNSPPVDPGSCDASFPDGQNVTLTAVPDDDSEFETWGGDCESAASNTSCTVTMSQARRVTATFGGGSCEPTGTALDAVLCLVIELLGQ